MASKTKYLSETRYAKLTIELLTKHEMPPTPMNYSVFYLYVTENNLELNQKINLQLNNDQPIDNLFMEGLFNQYISLSEQVYQNVMTPLNTSISGLLDKIEEQVAYDEEATESLNKIDDALKNIYQPESLNKVVDFLVKTVKNSTTQHKNLTENLNKTNSEINVLKDKLEIARKEAIVDMLTGLLNRRGCEERLQAINIEKTHTSLAIDIDHFKRINDEFGHFVGDKVIQHVANLIKSNVSEDDIAVRYGGEEFMVIMVNKTVTEAQITSDKIRLAISSLRLKSKSTDNFLPSISVSVGIAQTQEDKSWMDLFKRSDDALYQAKEAGRNCSIVAV